MRKLDKLALNICHKISNWIYKKFSLNNYGIAVIILTFALIASVYIAIMASKLAAEDLNPKFAQMRTGSALMAGAFFIGISLFVLKFNKEIGNFLSRKYDLEKTTGIYSKSSIFLRWFPIFMYPVSIIIGNRFWGMIDTLLFGFALMFLSCEPPKMEIRMSKLFKD